MATENKSQVEVTAAVEQHSETKEWRAIIRVGLTPIVAVGGHCALGAITLLTQALAEFHEVADELRTDMLNSGEGAEDEPAEA